MMTTARDQMRKEMRAEMRLERVNMEEYINRRLKLSNARYDYITNEIEVIKQRLNAKETASKQQISQLNLEISELYRKLEAQSKAKKEKRQYLV